MISEFGRWQIEYDPVATAECFAAMPVGNGCSCSDCRNFMAALDVAFPSDFRAATDQLGIDLRKPAELCAYNQEDSGLHYVGGWFHIVGRILFGADAKKPVGPQSWVSDLEKMSSGIEFGFSDQVHLIAIPFRSRQLVQLEFATRVPWVLPEPDPWIMTILGGAGSDTINVTAGPDPWNTIVVQP